MSHYDAFLHFHVALSASIDWTIFAYEIHRGVAARALHLSRGVEKPSGRVTYIVVLEGLCRFNVQELSTRGTYYTARITSLDMTKPGKFQVPLCICQSKYVLF